MPRVSRSAEYRPEHDERKNDQRTNEQGKIGLSQFDQVSTNQGVAGTRPRPRELGLTVQHFCLLASLIELKRRSVKNAISIRILFIFEPKTKDSVPTRTLSYFIDENRVANDGKRSILVEPAVKAGRAGKARGGFSAARLQESGRDS